MSRANFSDGVEIKYDDLNRPSKAIERQLYERILWQLMGKPSADAFFNTGLLVSRVDSTHVQVAAGLGIQYDSSQTSPETKRRPLYVASNTSLAITTPHATLNRIDIVVAKADLVDELTASRYYKDGSTNVISSVTQVGTKRLVCHSAGRRRHSFRFAGCAFGAEWICEAC
jgi:hypothetical protein